MKNRLCLFFIVFFYIYDKIYSYTGGELIDFESKSYEDNQIKEYKKRCKEIKKEIKFSK